MKTIPQEILQYQFFVNFLFDKRMIYKKEERRRIRRFYEFYSSKKNSIKFISRITILKINNKNNINIAI